MCSIPTCLTFVVLILAALSAPTSGQVSVGASFERGDLQGFYIAAGQFYRVPEREVVVIRERRVPDEEIPVVLFLSQQARVAPVTICDLRRAGRSWMDITIHFGLSPEIYYIPVSAAVQGPPYGRAYGYYKKHPRTEWKRIVLVDEDVINLVNLRFTSHHYECPPEQVMRLRSSGKTFVAISGDADRWKKSHPEGRSKDGDSRGNGNSNGKGRDKDKGGGKGKEK